MRKTLPLIGTIVFAITIAAGTARGAVISWRNAANGTWTATDTSKWTPAKVPTAGDTVVIAVTGASSYTVTLGAGTNPTITQLNVGASSGATTQTLTVSSQTLTVSDLLDIKAQGRLTLTNSTVVGANQVTNAGSLTLTRNLAPAMTLATPIHNAGALVVNGVITLNGALTTAGGSSLTVAGNGDLTQAGSVISNGTLSIGAGAAPGTLSLGGSLTVAAGTECILASATLECATGLANAGTLRTNGGSSRIDVAAGTLTNTGAINSTLGPLDLNAQLDNQGTIGAAYTLQVNKALATHTNTGSIAIGAPNNLFEVVGGTFNPDGGTLSGSGLLQISGGTAFLGGTHVVTQVRTTLLNATTSCASLTNGAGLTLTLTRNLAPAMTLAAPIHNAGALVVNGVITLNGALTTAGGSSLTVAGNGDLTQAGSVISNGTLAIGAGAAPGTLSLGGSLTVAAGTECILASATLECATGLANAGTLRTNGGSSRIDVAAGTLTNTGAINSTLGPLDLNAQLDNQGTIGAAYTLQVNKALATHTNTGSIAIGAPNNLFEVVGGTFNPDGGTLSGSGLLQISGGTAFLGGTHVVTQVRTTLLNATTSCASLTNAAGLTLTLTRNLAPAMTLAAPIHNAGALVVNGVITLNGALTTAGGSSLTVAGNGDLTQAGSVISNGTLAIGAGAAPGTLSLGGSLTVAAGTECILASATLECATGLANAGTLRTNGGSSRIDVAAGTLTNTGAINSTLGPLDLNAQLDNQGTIGAAYTLQVNKALATHTNTGSIAIGAPNNLFEVVGGTFNPDGGTLSGSGLLQISGGTAFLGGTHVVTQVRTTLLNATTSCASLTNGAGLTLTLTRNLAPAMTLATPIHNAGALVVNGVITLNGALTTAGGSSLTVAGNGDLTQAGSVISNGTLSIGAGAAPGTLSLGGSLTVAAGTECILASATLECATGLANAGTLRTNGGSSRIDVAAGTLTNTGAINSTLGPLDLNAQLDNQGTIGAAYTLQVNKALATHTSTGSIAIGAPNNLFTILSGALHNLGAGTIKGTGTLRVSAPGVTFINSGTLAPGLSTGTLTISGKPRFAPGGRLAIEVGGDSAGTFDRLAVSNAASDSVLLTGGTLDLSVVNGYAPQIGDSIAILTVNAGQLPDTFSTILGRDTGNGHYFNVRYKPSPTPTGPRRIDLIVGDPPPNNAPSAQDDAASVPEDGSALFDVLANDSDPDADSLRIVSAGPAAHGTATPDSTGKVRYTPAANYNGSDAFNYVIFDGRDGRDTALVQVTVVPVNDPPGFELPTPPNLTTYSVAQGTPVAPFSVKARDGDAVGIVTLTATGIPAGATLAPPLPANGNPVSSLFSWTPTVAQLGLHDLVFTATDDSGSIATTTVRVNVTPGGPTDGCGPGHHWIATCSPGDDTMGSGALAGIDFTLDGIADQSFVLTGPVTVRRSAPMDSSVYFPGTGSPSGHPDVIDTEILNLHLAGGGVTLLAGAGLGNGGVLAASRGTVVEQAANDSLANSFFDVFFEVTTVTGRLYNHDPLRITNTVDRLPPGGDYEHPAGLVALYDDPVGGNHVANLVSARHIVQAPPAACGTPHWLDHAVGGIDQPNSEADVGLDLNLDGNLDGEADVSFRLRGPVTVHRTGALDASANFPGLGAVDGHRDAIDTEILTMALSANGYTLRAGAGQGTGGTLGASNGNILERASDNTLADSFFDVFFEVETPLGPLYNHAALRLTSVVDCVPPVTSYLHPEGAIALYDDPVGGSHVANLVTARHTVGPDPGCATAHWIDRAISGIDSPNSEADVGIDLMADGNLDGTVDVSLRLQGPVTVRRSAAKDASTNFPGQGALDAHLDVIDTEILSMSLTASGYALHAGAGQGAGGVLGASRGTIVEKSADPTLGDSFFDVFFEVQTPQGPVYNQAPLHVTSVVNCVPPVTSYVHPDGIIPLYTSPVPGQGLHVANLVTARHTVGPAVACGQPHWLDNAAGGIDSPESEADVGIDLMNDGNLDGTVDVSLRLQGPVTVRRTAPVDQSVNFPGHGSADSHLDVMDTEILGMALTGSGFTLRAGAGQGAGATLPASKGTIVEQPADATRADSFFDVFFEVAVPGGTHVYNQTPLRVSSVIDCVPPVASYVHPDEVIPLYDSPIPGMGNHVANLVSARHRVGPQAPGFNCDVTGPSLVCKTDIAVHGVTTSGPTPTAYAWSVSGLGAAGIIGPTNLDHVTVLAWNNPGTYTVRVIVTAGAITDTCEKIVTVVDDGPHCTTPALLSMFEGSAIGEAIELRWRFGDPRAFAPAAVERSLDRNGPFAALAVAPREVAGNVVATDADVEPGVTYFYRLRATDTGGREHTFGPLAVTAGRGIERFDLGPAIPNPTTGAARLEFTVPRESYVEVTVHDIQGRRLAYLAAGRYRPGSYQVTWSGEIDRNRAPNGLYFVRYTTPDRTLVRRVVIVH